MIKKLLISNRKGEISAVLSLISIGLMLLGVAVGTNLTKNSTEIRSLAQSCPAGEWSCNPHCTEGNTRSDFCNYWCDGFTEWQENAGCGAYSGYQKKARSAGCPNDSSTVSISACMSGQAGSKPNTPGPTDPPGNPTDPPANPTDPPNGSGWNSCGGTTANESEKANFCSVWCDGERRWYWERENYLGTPGACGGQESVPRDATCPISEAQCIAGSGGNQPTNPPGVTQPPGVTPPPGAKILDIRTITIRKTGTNQDDPQTTLPQGQTFNCNSIIRNGTDANGYTNRHDWKCDLIVNNQIFSPSVCESGTAYYTLDANGQIGPPLNDRPATTPESAFWAIKRCSMPANIPGNSALQIAGYDDRFGWSTGKIVGVNLPGEPTPDPNATAPPANPTAEPTTDPAIPTAEPTSPITDGNESIAGNIEVAYLGVEESIIDNITARIEVEFAGSTGNPLKHVDTEPGILFNVEVRDTYTFREYNYNYTISGLEKDKKYTLRPQLFAPNNDNQMELLTGVNHTTTCVLNNIDVYNSYQCDIIAGVDAARVFYITVPNTGLPGVSGENVDATVGTSSSSGNADFDQIIEDYLQGLITIQQVSDFIGVLARTPGLQTTTCDPKLGGCTPVF